MEPLLAAAAASPAAATNVSLAEDGHQGGGAGQGVDGHLSYVSKVRGEAKLIYGASPQKSTLSSKPRAVGIFFFLNTFHDIW